MKSRPLIDLNLSFSGIKSNKFSVMLSRGDNFVSVACPNLLISARHTSSKPQLHSFDNFSDMLFSSG